MSQRRPRLVCGLCLLLGLGGCSHGDTVEGDCRRDSDCQQAYQRCDTLHYRCVCASDQACAAGEYCNASGSCQVKSKCLTNADCEDGSYCETSTGECVGVGTCTRDVQCALGQICDGGACRVGCRATSDCELLDREICLDGQCFEGRCDTTDYCPFGQVCNVAQYSCETPVDQPYCVPGCDPICQICTDKTQGPCGDPANLCGGQAPTTYCLVACAAEVDCPSGYDCVPSIYPHQTCEDDADCVSVVNTCGAMSHRCKLNQQPCDLDGDCHAFDAPTCLSGYCQFGHHCAPPGGCR